MRALAIGAVVLAGCFSPSPPTGVGCGPGGACPPGQLCEAFSQTCQIDPEPGDDGGPIPLDCEDWTFDPELIDPCAIPGPGPELVISGQLILDTDSGALSNGGDVDDLVEIAPVEVQLNGQAEAGLISTSRLVITEGSGLSLVGSRPLLIVSWSDASIRGDLRADAVGDAPGPGADRGGCEIQPQSDGDGGGPGGGGIGGFGGGGGGTDVSPPTGPSPSLPVGFYGGCSGQSGPAGNRGGGGGGGGVGVIALETVSVGGSVSANGAGGAAGGDMNMGLGGVGGGAGGLVVLVGSAVSVNGSVTANAGGGGGGGDVDSTLPAQPGVDGRRDGLRAGGGAGAPPGGGDGGPGGAGGPNRDGLPGKTGGNVGSSGGGGGGGGAGAVLISSQSPPEINGIVSPEP